MNAELARFILRPHGFLYDPAFPMGDRFAPIRQIVLSALRPDLRGKRGTVPIAKAGATIYRASLIDALAINRNQHNAAIDSDIKKALHELANQPERAQA